MRQDKAEPFGIGERLGPYCVLERIGKGGMGCVSIVEHERLGVRMALKSFAFEGKDREFLRKRFFAEGRLLARINDPHVVKVVDFDVEPQTDTPYFVMNLVVGPDDTPCTLADLSVRGELSSERLLSLYEDLRQALAVVHAAGIIHRDIKPENVLIGPDGHAVLSDFGICRIVDDDLRRQLNVTRTMVTDTTESRTVVGTVAYLSPEIRDGAEPSAADDFYALGVMFFRLLTGVWYAPGTNVMDLLLPFDAQWKAIFAALLAVDPARRTAPSLGRQKSVAPALAKKTLLGLVVGLLIAAVLVTVVWLRPTGEQKVEDLSYLDEMMYVPSTSR